MAVIDWKNTDVATFTSASAWTGGVVPGAADTAVINSTGDTAPAQNAVTGLLTPAGNDNLAFLLKTTTLVQDTVVQTTTPNGTEVEYLTTPAASTVPAGDTIAGGTIDLLGGGSEAALALQDTTLAAKVHVNISGDAYAYAAYTNTLAGTIDIGLPFTIAGKAVPAPPADANGFVNALYLDIQSYGSWYEVNKLNGYVPGVTNTGTIAIGAKSLLALSIAGEVAGQPVLLPNGAYYLAPATVSAFTNAGVISVQAGGSVIAVSQNGKGEFINKGIVSLAGAKGDQTETGISTAVSGTGTFVLAGGSQTDPGQTAAVFSNDVSGQTFKLSDATLFIDNGTGIKTSTFAVAGGNVDFVGTSGVLAISTSVDHPITSVFSDTISGFSSGDTLQLTYSQLPLAGTWEDYLSWNASTNTLDLYNARSDAGFGTTLEAAFKLNGSYPGGLSDFTLKASWNGTEASPTQVTITTSVAHPASKLLPSDWSALHQLGLAGALPHETATVSQSPSAFPTTDTPAALGHFDWRATTHDSAPIHFHP